MKHIVVIDDSVTIRASVMMSLKNIGMPIEQAENGSDALKRIKEIKDSGDDIAICITDVNMPVMDGITFLKELRKTEKNTPVLMLTTESGEGVIQAGRDAGASGWLVKPFTPEKLTGVVQKLIK